MISKPRRNQRLFYSHWFYVNRGKAFSLDTFSCSALVLGLDFGIYFLTSPRIPSCIRIGQHRASLFWGLVLLFACVMFSVSFSVKSFDLTALIHVQVYHKLFIFHPVHGYRSGG